MTLSNVLGGTSPLCGAWHGKATHPERFPFFPPHALYPDSPRANPSGVAGYRQCFPHQFLEVSSDGRPFQEVVRTLLKGARRSSFTITDILMSQKASPTIPSGICRTIAVWTFNINKPIMVPYHYYCRSYPYMYQIFFNLFSVPFCTLLLSLVNSFQGKPCFRFHQSRVHLKVCHFRCTRVPHLCIIRKRVPSSPKYGPFIHQWTTASRQPSPLPPLNSISRLSPANRGC